MHRAYSTITKPDPGVVMAKEEIFLTDFQKIVVPQLRELSFLQEGDFSIWKSWEKQEYTKYPVQFKLKGTEFIIYIPYSEDKIFFYHLEDVRRYPVPTGPNLFQYGCSPQYLMYKTCVKYMCDSGKILWPKFINFDEFFDKLDNKDKEKFIYHFDIFAIN